MKTKFVLFSGMMLLAIIACASIGPQAPAATPEPTPIPGWEKFEGSGVEIWMPDSFVGGDLEKDIETVTERLRSLGPDFEPTVQMIEQNPSLFKLWLFDTEVGSSGVLSNVNIISSPIMSSVTIDMYFDAVAQSFPDNFKLIAREKVTLKNYEAGRITTEFSITGTEGKQFLYLVLHDNNAWTITFTTGTSEFEERTPIFEQSMDTFKIVE
ncbi:MAG: hypothetical protein OEY93_13140 [Anaerolineae bacterium]|nr:hypothetical protein [Anaerolineae bacterium]